MNKEEYNIIMDYLNEGKIEDLKKYMMENKYINSLQKTLTELINSNCEKKYPSYYQRVNLKKGIVKLYRGLYAEMDNGFIICHDESNIFQLYDKSILTPKMIDMLEGSYHFWNGEKRKEYIQIINEIFSDLNKDKLKQIFSTKEENNKITAYSKNGYEIMIPKKYYNFAHNILGDDTSEYISGNGVYFDSPKGKALVMGMQKKYYK